MYIYIYIYICSSGSCPPGWARPTSRRAGSGVAPSICALLGVIKPLQRAITRSPRSTVARRALDAAAAARRQHEEEDEEEEEDLEPVREYFACEAASLAVEAADAVSEDGVVVLRRALSGATARALAAHVDELLTARLAARTSRAAVASEEEVEYIYIYIYI